MTKTHEKLLVATLAGLIIAGAGLLVVQPAFATGSRPGLELNGPSYEILTLRLAPAA
jgi:hypothetical protein